MEGPRGFKDPVRVRLEGRVLSIHPCLWVLGTQFTRSPVSSPVFVGGELVPLWFSRGRGPQDTDGNRW